MRRNSHHSTSIDTFRVMGHLLGCHFPKATALVVQSRLHCADASAAGRSTGHRNSLRARSLRMTPCGATTLFGYGHLGGLSLQGKPRGRCLRGTAKWHAPYDYGTKRLELGWLQLLRVQYLYRSPPNRSQAPLRHLLVQ